MRPAWEVALELFGPERLMWGSDWPMTVLVGGYGHAWEVMSSLVAELSPDEQERILSGTATVGVRARVITIDCAGVRSSKGCTMRRGCSRAPLTRCSSSSMASAAIARTGCASVVSGGSTSADHGGSSTPTSAMSAGTRSKSIIQSNPDLKGFYGANEGSAIGIIKGVQESGKKGITIVGFDSGKAQIDAIKAA